MPGYADDRQFTDLVHSKLALPLIYTPMRWLPCQLPAEEAKRRDMQEGIDYMFWDETETLVRVQERFREAKYAAFSDFTIRRRRDENPNPDRHQSEFYKIKADFFVYGITNGQKERPETVSNFLKFAVINLAMVYEKIENGLIRVEPVAANRCYVENGRMICPIKKNRDGSSDFFPIDIPLLVQLWGQETIKYQKGFL